MMRPTAKSLGPSERVLALGVKNSRHTCNPAPGTTVCWETWLGKAVLEPSSALTCDGVMQNDGWRRSSSPDGEASNVITAPDAIAQR